MYPTEEGDEGLGELCGASGIGGWSGSFERTLEDWTRRGTKSASGGFRACTTRKMSQRRLSYYTRG